MATKRKRSPAPTEAKVAVDDRMRTAETSKKAEDRTGLWVVVQGRLPQYGTQVIERPGQVIRQEYLRNDDVLLKHRYVRLLEEHEDVRLCEQDGMLFLGSNTVGPYKSHLDQTHGARTRKAKDAHESEAANPDSDSRTRWDLEEEGAPPPTKMEDEQPGGVRMSIGDR